MSDRTALATNEQTQTTTQFREEDVIFFEAGLIGYEDCHLFIVMENAALSPIHILQSVDRSDVALLVLDSKVIAADYNDAIPADAWRNLGVAEGSARLSLVVVVLGNTAEESTANLKAPLLINHETMTGSHVTLQDPRVSVTHPLISSQSNGAVLKAAAAGNRS